VTRPEADRAAQSAAGGRRTPAALALRRIGADDDDIGEIVYEIEDELEVEFDDVDVSEIQRVRDLVDLIYDLF
jgi:acyl carrier protein